jgi:signal peptidase I
MKGVTMKDKKLVIKEIRSWIFSIVGAFFIAVLLNTKVFAMVQVQQSSMENTLFSNQKLIVDKLSYNFAEPQKGDIIIFLENEENGTLVEDTLRIIGEMISTFKNGKDSSEDENRLVKRVIGVAGDEIDIKDGSVYVNGQKLEEAYVSGETMNGEIKLPIKIGEDKLFVLGDNRRVSKDSRRFGLIDIKQVEGKAIYRVYPFNKIGKIE